MIQRIQTIYLLFALITIGFTFVAPVWYFEADGMVERIQGFQHVLQEGPTLFFIEEIRQTQFFWEHPDMLRLAAHSSVVGLGLLAFLLVFIQIFSYKKRKRQIRQGRFAILLTMLQVLAFVYLTLQTPVFLNTGAVNRVDWGYALPIFTLLFIWLANRGIRKDEKLVRSVDRIR